MNGRRGPEKDKPGQPQPPNDSAPKVETPDPTPGPQEPPADRPNLRHFDRWIQKRVIPAMGGVILIAFLCKILIPVRYGFSLGLLIGVALLVVIYLIDFYRR
jgi:hypothetical protein